MNTSITQAELKEVLEYNPLTGEFRWVKAYNSKTVIGKVAGWKGANGYIKITLNRRNYYAHRLAWLYMTGAWPKDCVDHEDGDRTNNRWTNLRDVTHQENVQNRTRCWNKQGLMGVFKRKNGGRFFSILGNAGTQTYLGSFDTAEEAHQAYLAAKAKIHPFATIAHHINDQRRAA